MSKCPKCNKELHGQFLYSLRGSVIELCIDCAVNLMRCRTGTEYYNRLALYIGEDKQLAGYYAIIRPAFVAPNGAVLTVWTQFNSMDIVRAKDNVSLGTGWHEFQASDWAIVLDHELTLDS